MEEEVDILLTTYNSNIEYLKIQIDSILNQTYKNFKLIISDDCSTKKEVVDVLKEYEAKDDRIKLFIQEKNLGYTKNFEFVLNKSDSDYIAFCDHDDFWYNNKIEECLNMLKKKNVDLVYCDARQIDEKGKMLRESYLIYKNMPVINGKYKKDWIIPFSRHIAIGCSQLFTKDVKEKMLPFTENTMAHDWNSVYIANRLKGVYCIDKPLFDYRLHGNNAFGGRSFNQNKKIWKSKYGKFYNGYLKYRHMVITDTYLAGTLMCKKYSERFHDEHKMDAIEDEVLHYFRKCQSSKIAYFNIIKYFKYLYFKGMGKRAIKEMIILHFPILGFLVYVL